MGPQMNANTRKCKTHRFLSGVHVAGNIRVPGRNCIQAEFIYSRSFAFISGQKDISETNNKELISITVEGATNKATL